MNIFKYLLIALVHLTCVAGLHSDEVEKLVVIGAGAAGSSAAIFGAQADLNPLVIQDVDCAAQMSLIHSIDNYPGVLEDIDGYDLLLKFRLQAEKFGARFMKDTVTSVDLSTKPFKIEFASSKVVYADAIVVASGTKKKWTDLPSELALRGKGVVAATFCRDTDYQGKNVIVIGGGHAALQEAIHIADQAKTITIVNRGEKFNASKFHQNAVFEKSNIEVLYNTEVEEILDVTQDKVTGVMLRNRLTQATEQKSTDIVIVAIGNTPNSELFKDQLDMTPNGNIIIRGKNSSTNVPGVFAAGDITDVTYGRVIVASGSGAMAGLDAVRYLDTLKADKE